MIIQPPHFAKPKGYSNGILAEGKILSIAGMIGWNKDSVFETDDFILQVKQALQNIVDVLVEAKATPAHLVRLTWYIKDKQEYITRSKELGAVYKAVIGNHYPVMTLIVVKDLLEDRAKVEIEATAVIA
jgi:enamine deaminase RidA (YjgF/YER057c/UK114 family)